MHNRVRIIGGKHRGRKITFPNIDELRPTPDRVRVTLFNWLDPLLDGARCLDLFAGSGVLGLEALSRGAAFVVFLEKNPLVLETIQKNASLLNETSIKTVNDDVLSWLKSPATPFDIVFLDPPYDSHLLPTCFSLLDQHGWLYPHARIYFESSAPIASADLPKTWTVLREKKASHVYYYLAKPS